MAEFTTTHFALPSPTSAGEVKNGATNIKELAEKTDEVLYEGNKVANGQVYGAQVSRVGGTEYEPSASRATLVVLEAGINGAGEVTVQVGAVTVALTRGPSAGGHLVVSFVVPAGVKWKAITGGTVETLKSSYLLL